MKYIVLLGDGMSDYPISELNNKTPLQAACKPNMDLLAKKGEMGMVRTVPEGMPPGSDVANLAVMGYDPKKYYTGRSPLEAASMGIELEDTDVTFRTNLVTLSEGDKYADRIMLDHSADEITTDEARILINDVRQRFGTNEILFYPGVSYRHCMLWKNGPLSFDLTPPHDILDKCIAEYLPKGEHSKIILDMMSESCHFLSQHPVNQNRIRRGLKPANSLWIWGEGKKPAIPSFFDLYGLRGTVVSAVDLVKGIGICAGLDAVDVEGATGNIHTNYEGKTQAALDALKSGHDFVFIHVEAPDECGHRYEIENKVRSIELLDEKVLGNLLRGLEQFEDYRLLILPDHPTPLALRTHTSEPVPFIIYQKGNEQATQTTSYDEEQAKKSGIYIDDGHTLMDHFIKMDNNRSTPYRLSAIGKKVSP